MLGRVVPDVRCTVFFEAHEWKALIFCTTKDPSPPDQPPTLRQAQRMVAKLGGFFGRKSGREPGTKSRCLGLQRLDDLAAMFKVLRSIGGPDP